MNPVWVRGAGELGSAVAVVLHRVGLQVLISELETPLAIRRTASFSDAVLTGEADVEGVHGVHCEREKVTGVLGRGEVPIILDSQAIAQIIRPSVLVDARMLKEKSETIRGLAAFTIGLGPGFVAGATCDAVIETNRGHDLGRIIYKGATSANTGVPGAVGGESIRRVLHAPCSGKVNWRVEIGDMVREGEVLGDIDGCEITSLISGMVRGLISPYVPITQGLKISDVDPRGETVNYLGLSDKARATGRAVLEAVLINMRESGRGYFVSK